MILLTDEDIHKLPIPQYISNERYNKVAKAQLKRVVEWLGNKGIMEWIGDHEDVEVFCLFKDDWQALLEEAK